MASSESISTTASVSMSQCTGSDSSRNRRACPTDVATAGNRRVRAVPARAVAAGLVRWEYGASHTGCATTTAPRGQPLNSFGAPFSATLPCVEERYETELARSAAVLDGVDRALVRLDAGTYGRCETCGATILEADLERDPSRHLCEQHLTSG